MSDESLQDLLDRLERERRDADRLYNDALTAIDRALPRVPDMPHPPPAYDEERLPAINAAWNLLPSGPPAIDSSLKGRLRGFIWRLVGPPFDRQQHFNAAVVDHLNRNVAAHRESQRATATLIALVREQLDALAAFEGHLLRYLQSITLYVDTKDRTVGGQAQVLNDGLNALTDGWLKRWESLSAREQRFVARTSALDQTLDDVRATAVLAQQTALSLKREVERLLSGATAAAPAASGRAPGDGRSTRPDAGPASSAAPAADLESFKYVGFEDAFRGSREDIRARLTDYVARFAGASDVLEIGCGRGEFLDLLRQHGIRARGVDTNHEMVETCRAMGLDAVKGDALTYLSSVPDASLGGVFAAQVVEHLEPAYLGRLIETALHKLRPGSLIILETINVACWAAFFDSYIRDLTHVRPLHPETLQYLLRASGFHDVTIEYRAPIPASERLQPIAAPPAAAESPLADLVDTFNANVEKLNVRMFTSLDYAIVGRK